MSRSGVGRGLPASRQRTRRVVVPLMSCRRKGAPMAEPKGWGTVAAKRHKTVGVGFKNPSKRGRFRKGQSGNPAGRPKVISNAATVFARVFGKLMDINERGRQKKISKLEVLFTTVLNDAIK